MGFFFNDAGVCFGIYRLESKGCYFLCLCTRPAVPSKTPKPHSPAVCSIKRPLTHFKGSSPARWEQSVSTLEPFPGEFPSAIKRQWPHPSQAAFIKCSSKQWWEGTAGRGVLHPGSWGTKERKKPLPERSRSLLGVERCVHCSLDSTSSSHFLHQKASRGTSTTQPSALCSAGSVAAAQPLSW